MKLGGDRRRFSQLVSRSNKTFYAVFTPILKSAENSNRASSAMHIVQYTFRNLNLSKTTKIFGDITQMWLYTLV